MDFNKDKIETAITALNNACLHCGSSHSNECPISIARQALKSTE